MRHRCRHHQRVTPSSKSIKKLEIHHQDKFILGEDTLEICNADHDFPSIYFFELLNNNSNTNNEKWFEEFRELWEHSDYYKKHVPSITRVRMNAHLRLKRWMPIYIGKSKHIGKRINKHIFLDIIKTTYALKLKARSNIHGYTFRISAIKLKVANYDAIIPEIEKALRNTHHPIIGKQ